jgi:deoxyribonuclease IV
MPDPAVILDTVFDPEDEYVPQPEPEPVPPAWLEGGLRIGIHTSIAGSYLNALESARKLGCTALQIFSASPRMWQGGPARIPNADAAAFRARREELGLGPLIIHANYLINLAAAQPMLRTRSIQAFHEELVRSIALGADFVVVHPGSRPEGIPAHSSAAATVAESIKQAAKRVQLGKLRILIENTAGQGNCLGCRLEEVGEIVQRLAAFNAGACLDTAHLFASGYDISTEAGLAVTIAKIDDTIGLHNVPVFHANDSKIPLGGRVDRHAHIGRGKIGAAAFERVLHHPRLSAISPEGLPGRAFIAETPIDDPGDDRKNVARLWELAGLQGPTPDKNFSMLTPALKKKLAAVQKSAKSARKSAMALARASAGVVTRASTAAAKRASALRRAKSSAAKASARRRSKR